MLFVCLVPCQPFSACLCTNRVFIHFQICPTICALVPFSGNLSMHCALVLNAFVPTVYLFTFKYALPFVHLCLFQAILAMHCALVLHFLCILCFLYYIIHACSCAFLYATVLFICIVLLDFLHFDSAVRCILYIFIVPISNSNI